MGSKKCPSVEGFEVPADNFRNGPIEYQDIIFDSLQNSKIVICDIMIPYETVAKSVKCKHAVLIIKKETDKLFMHDPLKENKTFKFESGKTVHLDHECGTN